MTASDLVTVTTVVLFPLFALPFVVIPAAARAVIRSVDGLLDQHRSRLIVDRRRLHINRPRLNENWPRLNINWPRLNINRLGLVVDRGRLHINPGYLYANGEADVTARMCADCRAHACDKHDRGCGETPEEGGLHVGSSLVEHDRTVRLAE